MNRSASPRLRTFLVLVVVGLIGGLAAGRPELVALAAPFAMLVGAGLAAGHDVALEVGLSSDRERALEGEVVKLILDLQTDVRVGKLDVDLDLPAALTIEEVDGVERVRAGGALRVAPGIGEPERLVLSLRCGHWGAHRVGSVRVRGRDALGLFTYSTEFDPALTVKVFPDAPTVRALLRPLETGHGFGDLVSRGKGGGLEYADLRAMQPGDDPRQINWRATARRGETWVNERHPERNSDVVLVVDTLAEPRRGVEVTLDLAVRAAAGLGAAHLRRNDRVGLISFGEPVRWLQPGMGAVQRYRILDTLLESRSHHQMYWRGVSAVPRRSLPAKALVIGLSPLLDDRAISAFADLRGRGFDLAVIEIPAELFLPAPSGAEERLVRRVWELQREATRSRFRRHGVATVRWDPGRPFQEALMEVEAFRRNARRAPA